MQLAPESKLRQKLISAIDVQVAAPEASAKGDTVIRCQRRRVDDAETGERVPKVVPVRFAHWGLADSSALPPSSARHHCWPKARFGVDSG